MANLIETPQWETGVYQIETTDPVVGGPDGISNIQAKQLANRTAYLKTTLESLATELAALGITDVAGLQAALDGKTPWAVADAVISAAGLTPNHANLNQLLTALQSLGLRSATGSQTGVVELATAAEVLAGTDATRAVTPAGLLAGLLGAGGVGASDYIAIPFRDRTTGLRRNLLIQWAYLEADTNTFSWPIVFPSACLAAVPGAVVEALNDYNFAQIASFTVNGGLAKVYGALMGQAPTSKSHPYIVIGIGY